MNELKLQSERSEREALESLHRQCPPKLAAELGLELLDVDGTMVSCCTADPSILLNRAVGRGDGLSETPDTIRAVAAEYSGRGIGDYFLHLYEDAIGAAGRDRLEEMRLHRRRGWMKFLNAAPAGRAINTELTVEAVTRETANDFAAIVCAGFGLRRRSVPLIAGLAGDARWHLFLSRYGSTPAGAGGLFVDGRFGWLDWAATRPEFRRRGSQSAIMSARLDLAAELGCGQVFTETGEAVEGDPQHSYGNILKAGFKKLGPRSNYSPRPAPD